jgi:hypothetical protein
MVMIVAPLAAQNQEFDLLIRSGYVIDPTTSTR